MTLSLSACTSNDTTAYDGARLPKGTKIALCDEARVREDPHIDYKHMGSWIVLEFDTGNAPEGSCVEVPVKQIYQVPDKIDQRHGVWYGIREGELAEVLTDLPYFSLDDDFDNIVWINEAKAQIISPNETLDNEQEQTKE